MQWAFVTITMLSILGHVYGYEKENYDSDLFGFYYSNGFTGQSTCMQMLSDKFKFKKKKKKTVVYIVNF